MSDDIIAKKLCNFLFENVDAELSIASNIAEVTGINFNEDALNIVLDNFKRIYGGLWVGGSAYLTKDEFRFVPNLINKMFHKGDCTLSIPLTEILQTNVHFGFFTKIISLSTNYGTFKMRCYGANKFRDSISDAIVSAKKKR